MPKKQQIDSEIKTVATIKNKDQIEQADCKSISQIKLYGSNQHYFESQIHAGTSGEQIGKPFPDLNLQVKITQNNKK